MEIKRDNPCCRCGANVHMSDEEYNEVHKIYSEFPEGSAEITAMSALCDDCLSKGLKHTPPGLLSDEKSFMEAKTAATAANMVRLGGIVGDLSVGAYICPNCSAVHMKIEDGMEPQKCNAFAMCDEDWDELFKIVTMLRRERDGIKERMN